MNKIKVLLLTVFLNGAFFSCNPTSIIEDELIEQQATDCCDGEEDIPPIPGDEPDGTNDNSDCCDGEEDIPPTP